MACTPAVGDSFAAQARRPWVLRHALLAAAAVAVAGAVLAAEAVTVGGEDYAGDGAAAAARGLRGPGGAVRTYRLPSVTAHEASAEDGASARPLRIGIGRDFERLTGAVPHSRELEWRRAPDGGATAHLAVVSPGARALRAELAFERLPPGSEVRVYAPRSPTASVARVRLEGVRVAGTPGATASVWTPTVCGPVLAVELYLPPGAVTSSLRVAVPRLSHLDGCPWPTGSGGAAGER